MKNENKQKMWSIMGAIKYIGRTLKNIRFSSIARAKKLKKEPIIIVGCARSSTTILASMMSSNKNIVMIPTESRSFLRPYSRNEFLNKRLAQLSMYLALITSKIPKTAKRWCEKTPGHGLYIKEILNLYPNVKIINIVRDGRDVIISRLPNKKEFFVKPEQWIREVEAALKYEKNPQVLTIRYEDLVKKPKQTFKKIRDFIEEDFSDILQWHKKAKVRYHSSWEGEVKKLHIKSIKKWEKDFKLKKKVDEFIKNKKVQKLLKHYGYKII